MKSTEVDGGGGNGQRSADESARERCAHTGAHACSLNYYISMSELRSVTIMSSSGEIVIPKPIRDALQLKEGEEFDIEIEGNRLILIAHNRALPDWRSLRGAFGPSEQAVADIIAETRQEQLDIERRKLAGLRS
jgi:AbrB family looped-hinge helix DNA binding protein